VGADLILLEGSISSFRRIPRGHKEAGRYLEKYAFPEVYNVLHGFEGDMDETRHRSTRNGWRHDGLPWEQT